MPSLLLFVFGYSSSMFTALYYGKRDGFPRLKPNCFLPKDKGKN